MVAPIIDVGEVKIGSPPSKGERFSPAGASKNPKAASRKYHVAPAPAPKVRRIQNSRIRIRRPKTREAVRATSPMLLISGASNPKFLS